MNIATRVACVAGARKRKGEGKSSARDAGGERLPRRLQLVYSATPNRCAKFQYHREIDSTLLLT